LCGSGKKYKRCCHSEETKKSGEHQKDAFSSLNEGNYRAALTSIRRSITNYTINHKSHTELLLSKEPTAGEILLKIDLEALSELVGVMLDCFRGLGDYDQFLESLERMRRNIKDPQWQRKITYFEIIGRLGDDWSETVGQREIKKLLPIDNETDPEIMQLCIQYLGSEFGFRKRDKLITRLISLVKTHQERLQYKLVLASLYFEVGDEAGACSITEEALEEYEKTPEDKIETYGRHYKASALNFLGILKNSTELQSKSLHEFTALLKEDIWTSEGIARLHSEIVGCCYGLGKYQDAIDCYNSSLSFSNSDLTRVFMARALCLNQDESAIELIESIDASSLDSAGKLDFFVTYATIGIHFKKEEMLKNSIQMLRIVDSINVTFDRQKAELLQEISEVLLHGFNEARFNKMLVVVRDWSKKINRYLVLQPNIAGLGINVNRVVEDVQDKKKTKPGD